MSELALKLIAENKAKHARGEDARVLDLGNCGLKELPKELGELVWLEELILSDTWEEYELRWLELREHDSQNIGSPNGIQSIQGIERLGALRKLVVLKRHPGKGGKWTINDLSPLAGLENLQDLYCCNTQVSDLSPLAQLTKLRALDCYSTNISDISPLANLRNLEILDISITEVSDLSPLKELTKLHALNCSSTRIFDLTPLQKIIEKGVIVKLGHLLSEGILVEYCPLTNPPPAIVQQGNDSILNYFAEREKAQFKNTEIKLILVGNSTSGKTSLSRFLRERTYEPEQFTTHGIHNERWEPEGHKIQVNIWDFGGQEYYHATHRLFLSSNAVYGLVWDRQTDKGGYCETTVHFDNDSEPSILQLEHFPKKWWVQNIQHFTRESNPPVPIFLVQNKCVRDGIERVSSKFENPPFNLLSEWLDNNIDIETTAAHLVKPQPETRKWQRNFEAFEECLLNLLQTQMAHYEFAVYHRDNRDKVRQLAAEGVNDMSYADFEKLCQDIEPDAKMDLVQIYLRDITGDILYYPQNQRLRDRVFLRPNWVCDCIYQILSRHVQTQNGLFGKEWVQESLQCDEAKALDFVELMREFELVFDDSDEAGHPTGQFVAPQYLPDSCTRPDKLEAVKEYVNLTHAFTLWFPDFLPKSHIARFVANWGSQAKHRLFWKNGLLFQTDGCTALVERIEENKIRVELQANHPKQEDAMRHVFQSFMQIEDGHIGFAVSLDECTFVWWRDVQGAVYSLARLVPTYPHVEPATYTELEPFFIFQHLANIHNKLNMKDKIRKLLQEAKTKEGLELLITLVPDAGVLLTSFNEAAKRYSLGILDFKDFSQKQNEVTYAALGFLNDFKEPSPAVEVIKPSPAPAEVKKVFISYSHKDEEAMKELDKFLGPLERKGEISIWTDRKILPGQLWKNAILTNLEDADLTLLLVSANFLDSDFINMEEIPRALKRKNEGGKHVVPVILNYCLWDITSLSEMQAIPKDGRPVADFPNPAQAWSEIARGILSLLKE